MAFALSGHKHARLNHLVFNAQFVNDGKQSGFQSFDAPEVHVEVVRLLSGKCVGVGFPKLSKCRCFGYKDKIVYPAHRQSGPFRLSYWNSN